ncbi:MULTISPECIES: alpha/beta fold hydrolase [unclassified Crossiella]|uniref:alpha/beta fold hydrolase n=1 Tax=unclassified Crossiella TaxID=2620835 RepID=UPI001FFF0A64|nr:MULTISPECIES: alpha/beta hydrolase [unclassified Crossiella]MCK2237287.1 alpha/beta hydrolase [Crossiella sp. S99.2]MCK2250942.1 alpha/beta hydrolase [Crossiella sp. S99.1]
MTEPSLRTAGGAGLAPLSRAPLSVSPLPEPDFTRKPWPGQVRSSGGVRLHVRETPGPAEETAVYIHGLGGSSTNWTDLADLLSGRMNGLALDAPGFGRSEPLAGHDYSVRATAALMTRFIEGLDRGPVHLFGNSLGGVVSLLVAAGRPDLVRTLTLVSPAVPDLRPDPRRFSDPRFFLALLPLVGRRVRRQLAEVTPRQRAEQLVRLCFAQPELVPEHRMAEAEAEYLERRQMRWAGEALGRTTMGLFRAWLEFSQGSLWRLLPKVSAPTTVIWGTEDRLVSVGKAPRTARLLPSARLLVLPRTGHVAQMEKPLTVARASLGMIEAVDRGEW